MKRIISIIIFIITYHGAKSQSCDCKTNLDSLVSKVEDSYAGYFDKTSGENSSKYKHFKDSLALEVKSATSYGCYLLLREYVSFFRDPHLNLFLVNLPPKSNYEDTLRSMFTSLRKVSVDTNELREYYQRGSKDEIEGVWNALTFDFGIAIRKESKGPSNRYEGIAIKADSIRWFRGKLR